MAALNGDVGALNGAGPAEGGAAPGVVEAVIFAADLSGVGGPDDFIHSSPPQWFARYCNTQHNPQLAFSPAIPP